MRKVKSIVFAIAFFSVIFGGMYFIPVKIGYSTQETSEKEIDKEQIIEEPIDEKPLEEKVEVVDIQPEISESKDKEISVPVAPPQIKSKEEVKPKIVEPKKVEPKQEEKPKKEEKKEEVKNNPKESKIGVDRKLISGIPGTMKYKGKLPPHSVKEKGSITISYTVNEDGNVVSAYRVDGIRDRNTINNAITLIKKYVKAEKAKTSSVGTYTIDFK